MSSNGFARGRIDDGLARIRRSSTGHRQVRRKCSRERRDGKARHRCTTSRRCHPCTHRALTHEHCSIVSRTAAEPLVGQSPSRCIGGWVLAEGDRFRHSWLDVQSDHFPEGHFVVEVVRRTILRICSMVFKSGDKPPCMQKIFSSMIANLKYNPAIAQAIIQISVTKIELMILFK